MKKKTVLIIGILAAIMAFSTAIAFAQNSSDNKYSTDNHECTPEMMKDMSKNCPDQMMKSGECKNMMDGEKGHSGMMGNGTAGESHCGDKDSDMGSMMGSGRDADMKSMM